MAKVYYWTDLHFDARTKGTETGVLHNFWLHVKKIKKDDLLVLGGDNFNCWMNNIPFLKKLNGLKIKILFVIGNHDYWNDVIKTANKEIGIQDTNDIFAKTIKSLKNITLLDTGVIYKWNNYTFIGCNGYYAGTSYDLTKPENMKGIAEVVAFHGMMKFVTNPSQLQKELEKKWKQWTTFYQKVSKKEQNLIVVTHQPTWTWMDEEILLPNVKYINGHDHYFIDGIHRKKGSNTKKTAPNNYNDGQNTNTGLGTVLRYFEI